LKKNTLLHTVSRTKRPEKIKKFDPSGVLYAGSSCGKIIETLLCARAEVTKSLSEIEAGFLNSSTLHHNYDIVLRKNFIFFKVKNAKTTVVFCNTYLNVIQ
jgi:peptidase E